MEFAQGSLKVEMAGDEFNGGSNYFTGDDLFVDELLDFSNGFSETEGEQLLLEEAAELEDKKSFYLSKEIVASPENIELGPLFCCELNAPAEDLESLEWLSHFVEDSFSDYSLTVKLPHATAEYQSKPAATVEEQRCFTATVQTKARTKRARSGVRVLPVLSPSSVTESSTSSSSSSYSTLSFSPIPVHYPTVESLLGKKMKPAIVRGALTIPARRCSHCGVTKTPQWRAGPLGSKTLCNACGVRFKSGRLLPEYRPACSPTFSSEIHSNNHRKVLEMRRKKDSEVEPPV